MPYVRFFLAISRNIEGIVAHGGYAFLLIATVLEGIPLIGMFVPGHISIIVAGFLARVGTLNLYWVISISIFGAIAGDFFGFYLGRKYGMSFIDRMRPYFFIRDSHIEKARSLLGTHTGKSMIIGRFSPVTRALMPFMVGASETSVGKFWLFNVIGGVSWAISSILLGYIFGAGYGAVAGYFGKFVVGSILFAVIIIWGYRFINIRFHIFKKYELFTLGLNVISLWALAETIQDAFSVHSFMAGFDVWVNIFMSDHVTPFISSVALIITNAGGTVATSFVGLFIGIWFLLKRKWRSAAIMIMSLASTATALGVMKEFFMRTRPENALIPIVNDPSFPSGHAGMAAAFFFILAYLLAPKIHSWIRRELMVVVCVLAIVAVGLSRIVLNVHWTSDVIAGWSLGLFLSTSSILFVRYVGALVTKKREGE